MKKNLNFIIHFFIILSIFFLIQAKNIFDKSAVIFAEEIKTDGEDLTAKLNSNQKISCEKTKKKIQAAIELYMVENGIKSNTEISIDDLLKNGMLKFEPACPEGGKYKISKNIVECLKCDKPTPAKAILPPLPGHGANKNQISNETNEVAEVNKEKKIKNTTLEVNIDKYINKEDAFILDKTEKTEDKKTKETEVFKKDKTTAEVNITGPDIKAVQLPSLPETKDTRKQVTDKNDESKEPAAEQIQPETPVIGKSAKDFHREAIEHARKGEIDKALEKFRKAIELVPDSFTYHYNYGLFLAKIENFDLAYIEFQRALRLKPDEKKVKDMIEKLKKAISFR